MTRTITILIIFVAFLFLGGCAAEINPNLSNDVAKEIVRREYFYAGLGLWMGFVLIILGVILVIIGVAGYTSFVVTFAGVSLTVPNAPLGVVLIVTGLALIYITYPKIKSLNKKE